MPSARGSFPLSRDADVGRIQKQISQGWSILTNCNCKRVDTRRTLSDTLDDNISISAEIAGLPSRRLPWATMTSLAICSTFLIAKRMLTIAHNRYTCPKPRFDSICAICLWRSSDKAVGSSITRRFLWRHAIPASREIHGCQAKVQISEAPILHVSLLAIAVCLSTWDYI